MRQSYCASLKAFFTSGLFNVIVGLVLYFQRQSRRPLSTTRPLKHILAIFLGKISNSAYLDKCSACTYCNEYEPSRHFPLPRFKTVLVIRLCRSTKSNPHQPVTVDKLLMPPRRISMSTASRTSLLVQESTLPQMGNMA